MRKSDLWSAGVLLLFGLLAAFEARQLTVGEPGKPGPGFFPFFLAVALSLVTLALVVRSVLNPEKREAVRQESPVPLQWGKVAWTLVGLFAYAFLLEPLGFPLATVLLMFFLFRAVDPLSWAGAVGGSLATSLLTYALFKFGLGVRLPPGPWGP